MSQPFYSYAVYRNPRDYPGKLVVRQWAATANRYWPIDPPFLITDNIAEVHLKMRELGLVMLLPGPDADPVIIEEWL